MERETGGRRIEEVGVVAEDEEYQQRQEELQVHCTGRSTLAWRETRRTK